MKADEDNLKWINMSDKEKRAYTWELIRQSERRKAIREIKEALINLAIIICLGILIYSLAYVFYMLRAVNHVIN